MRACLTASSVTLSPKPPRSLYDAGFVCLPSLWVKLNLYPQSVFYFIAVLFPHFPISVSLFLMVLVSFALLCYPNSGWPSWTKGYSGSRAKCEDDPTTAQHVPGSGHIHSMAFSCYNVYLELGHCRCHMSAYWQCLI
jgi:hypothetical protein